MFSGKTSGLNRISRPWLSREWLSRQRAKMRHIWESLSGQPVGHQTQKMAISTSGHAHHVPEPGPLPENGHFHIWGFSLDSQGPPKSENGPLSEQPCPGAGALVQKMAIPTSGLYWLESQLVTELRRRPFPHLGLLSERFPHLGF